MPPIPGTVNGEKVADKRTYILPGAIIDHYKRNGKWDRITDVRATDTEKEEVITVRIGDLRHTWKLKRNYNNQSKWTLVKELWVR